LPITGVRNHDFFKKQVITLAGESDAFGKPLLIRECGIGEGKYDVWLTQPPICVNRFFASHLRRTLPFSHPAKYIPIMRHFRWVASYGSRADNLPSGSITQECVQKVRIQCRERRIVFHTDQQTKKRDQPTRNQKLNHPLLFWTLRPRADLATH